MPKRKQQEAPKNPGEQVSRRCSKRQHSVKIKVEQEEPSFAEKSVVTPEPCLSSTVDFKKEISVAAAKVSSSDSAADVTRPRPTPLECQYAVDPEVVVRNAQRRRELFGSCGGQDTILDGVVSTILSQNTTQKNSTEAFRRLKQRFPTWETYMRHESNNKKKVKLLEEAIRCGGLAEIKAARIHAMLETLQEERGSCSLEFLRHLSDEAVKTELQRFKGLGPKTISCVLLFTMGRPEFPVDTHVHRISKNAGWIPSSCTAEGAYEHLNSVVPDDLKLDLHCLLITHGKQCHRCAARGKPQFPPKDGTRLDCPLIHIHKTKGLKLPASAAAKVDVVIKKEPGSY